MDNDKRKIVIIDFCGTIVTFQSFIPYLQLILKCEKPFKYKLLSNKVINFFIEIIQKGLFHAGYKKYIYKRVLLHGTKGISRSKFEEYAARYYREKIKTNFISETIKLLENLKKNGYRLMIVSGGCDLYIRKFAEEFNIVDVIATCVHFDKKGNCAGKIEGRDCLGAEKVFMLEKYLGLEEMKKIKAVVSDSDTDIPLFMLGERKIVISHKDHQKWVGDDMELPVYFKE